MATTTSRPAPAVAATHARWPARRTAARGEEPYRVALDCYARRVTAGLILAFTALAAVLTVLPGSDFAFTPRWALRGGPAAAFAAALGIALGSLCWAAASAVGLVALLRASRLGYDAVRVAGAAYLIVLGVQSLRGAGRDQKATPLARQGHGERGGQPQRRGFRRRRPGGRGGFGLPSTTC
jgi:LysE type translocator